MIVLIIIMAVITVLLAVIAMEIHPLIYIDYWTKGVKIINSIILIIGAIIIYLADAESEDILLSGGVFVALLGIQQEIFIGMREKFAEYVTKHSKEAKFVVECIIDDCVIGWIKFPEDDKLYDAAFLGEENLEAWEEYSVDLYINYNRRGLPDMLFCKLKKDGED